MAIRLMTPLPSYLTSHYLFFFFLHIPRYGQFGGRGGLFVSDALSFSQISLPDQPCIETICSTTATGPGTACFTTLNLYCPPRSDTVFFDEFQNILSSLTTSCQNFVITGVFNLRIHLIPMHTVLKCFMTFLLLLIYNNLYPSPLKLMVILLTF